ncbi:MAG: hypothetical protein ACRELX_14585 [Longimicrobiales bacterium]
MAARVRVTLHWIQILDTMEPFYKARGEFRFTTRVTSDVGARVQETRFPAEGHYEISDQPGWNKLNLDRVTFEDEVASRLMVELLGEELDDLSGNDHLDRYERVFEGMPASWVGVYGPGDKAQPTVPEVMRNWRVSYSIELV